MDQDLMNVLEAQQIPCCHHCGLQEVFIRSLWYNGSIAPNGFILLRYTPEHLLYIDEFNIGHQENFIDICPRCGAELIYNVKLEIVKEFDKVGFQI